MAQLLDSALGTVRPLYFQIYFYFGNRRSPLPGTSLQSVCVWSHWFSYFRFLAVGTAGSNP